MFENIIGQDRAVAILRAEMREGRLPGSVLIHGEPYSGKLSIGLEIARVLACAEDGAWECACASCRSHRLLTHPGTLLLGGRSWLPEIRASADTLKRTRAPSSRYLYVRAVRKLTRRCDPLLWEGSESRMRPVFAAAAEAEDMLGPLEPPAPLPEGEELDRLLEKLYTRSAQVAGGLPRDNIPIAVLRNAAYWTRQSAPGLGRTIILENADRMMDSSRNALLKLLEEPPAGVHLVLLSTNHRALIATVLSRVRRYALRPRSPESSREVLSRVFRETSGRPESLGEFFRTWEGVPVEATTEVARLFLATALAPAMDERPLMSAYAACQGASTLDAAAFYREFSRTLVSELREAGRTGAMDLGTLTRWSRVAHAATREQSELNLQPQLALQATLYRLRDERRGEPAR